MRNEKNNLELQRKKQLETANWQEVYKDIAGCTSEDSDITDVISTDADFEGDSNSLCKKHKHSSVTDLKLSKYPFKSPKMSKMTNRLKLPSWHCIQLYLKASVT